MEDDDCWILTANSHETAAAPLCYLWSATERQPLMAITSFATESSSTAASAAGLLRFRGGTLAS